MIKEEASSQKLNFISFDEKNSWVAAQFIKNI